MGDGILLLDCDGVIFDSLPLIDKYVQKVFYKASDKYCKELDSKIMKLTEEYYRWLDERSNSKEELEEVSSKLSEYIAKRKEHYVFKDQVLEEVYQEFKNKINYFEIYRYENTFPGVVAKIQEISDSGLYKKIYIVTHCNSSNEVLAKAKFFQEYLPMVELVFVRFHDEPYHFTANEIEVNSKRKRTNKIAYFRKVTGVINLKNATFIDDSESIVKDAITAGVGRCYYRKKQYEPLDVLEKAFNNDKLSIKRTIKKDRIKSLKLARKGQN